ncbi:ABC transporter substrate-binding protein [Natribacillus halophilus]|uniref:Peptide/nickel transport system substrate-binding protein n=1 Tax=Natribacillus halophilus TaxID=549003 RepID=A0A1G8SAV2_9BACI|nr:ABC transporter substrate-binding protein [Natribacillus halophilus]SDJ25780.1 peptide/nickel transport system substrate-binding protein [Natribacillus halophilus]
MGKKAYWLFLAMVLTLGLLAACNGAEEDVEGEPDDEDPDVEDEEAEGDDGEDGEDGEVAGEPQEGGEIIIGQTGDPNNFHSAYMADTQSTDVADMIHASLLRNNDEMEMEPDIAADMPEVSDDGLTYTIELQDDVYFHDGEQVTADDVVFTYEVFLDEDYTGPRTTQFEYVDSIEATEELEVTIELTEPDAALEASALGFEIMPEHILGDVAADEQEEHDFSTSDEVVGAGPYEMTEWDYGTSITLDAHEDYHNEGPYLDTLTLRIAEDENAVLAMLQAGEVDHANIRPQDVETAEAIDGVNVVAQDGYNYNYIGWNHDRPPFDDPDVRTAMTMAIDREAIIDGVLQGHAEPAHFPHHPMSWAHTDEVDEVPYDPDGAIELLEEAGFEQNDEGQMEWEGEPFSFELLTNQESHARVDWVVVVQEMLADIGIDVQTDTMEFGAYLDRIQTPNYDFDAIAGAWALSVYPDPEPLFHSDQYEQGQNNIRYDSEEFDELAEDNRAIVDEDERTEAVQDAYAQVAEDQAYTFMYYPDVHQAHIDEIQNFQMSPESDYYRVEEWWLEE